MRNILGMLWGIGAGIFLMLLLATTITNGINQQSLCYCGGFLLGSCIIFFIET